jgi:alpha-galactosidase
MNRRHFLRSTGLSLGALLIRPGKSQSSQGNPGHDQMGMPDRVSVVTDDATIDLQMQHERSWIGSGIEVRCIDDAGAVAVEVQAPDVRLRSVVLSWSRWKSSTVFCLNDQWERSYGDLKWAPIEENRLLPWYFMEREGKLTNGFGVRTGGRSFCCWQAGTDSLRLTIDVRSGGVGVSLGDRLLRAAEIVVRKGVEGESPFTAARAMCIAMCGSPRLPEKPVYGLNDWYFTYGNNSEEMILDHVDLLADLSPRNGNDPYCVIDAGWAVKSPRRPDDPAWGDDFTGSNPRFPDMGGLADKIRARGMRPGIWTRPLCARLIDDRRLLLPPIPGRDDPSAPILDPTIPENAERIRNLIALYPQWGYTLIKHDFTTWDLFGKWGFQMIETRDITSPGWRFSDSTRTNAEVFLDLYRIIRGASGGAYIIGCNTVSHLSAGIFELQRVGDDTSGLEWDRTRKMGVNTLGFRMPQHLSFYSADPDCVGLTTKVPWEKNRQWMQLVAESGTPLFISAQKEATGPAQREAIRKNFKTASEFQQPGEPLDWLENQFPRRWRLLGTEVQFDWA